MYIVAEEFSGPERGAGEASVAKSETLPEGFALPPKRLDPPTGWAPETSRLSQVRNSCPGIDRAISGYRRSLAASGPNEGRCKGDSRRRVICDPIRVDAPRLRRPAMRVPGYQFGRHQPLHFKTPRSAGPPVRTTKGPEPEEATKLSRVARRGRAAATTPSAR